MARGPALLSGNPEVKAKIRKLRQSRSRKRMMAAVPTASVVITNPTRQWPK
jgi:flagellar biosynthetic protein FlhB